jgi:hypothetical protein
MKSTNIIPFKLPSVPVMNSHGVPKRRKVLLTIEPISKKIRSADARAHLGFFNGKLAIGSHNFYSDNATFLGIIAYICDVGSVKVSTLSSQQSFILRSNKNHQHELEWVEADDERAFLKHFHDGLYMCTHSRKQSREFVDWLENGLFPLAMTQVPASMQIHTKLVRGVYDDSGIPLSEKAIAHRARNDKMIRELQSAIQGILPPLPNVLNIDLTQIAHLDGGQVIYSGSAEASMRRLIMQFGFNRLPATWSELNGLVDYCKYLWIASGEQFVPVDLIPDWQRTGRNIDLRLAPWRVPAFDAYVANDLEKLRHIHVADNTLERIGVDWQASQLRQSHYLPKCR